MFGTSQQKNYIALALGFFDSRAVLYPRNAMSTSISNLRFSLILSCLCVSILSTYAHALNYSASLFVDGAYESNVNNVSFDERSDIQQDVGLAINASQLRGPLTFTTDYRGSHRDHKQDFNNDSTRFSGFSEIRYITLQNRVAWTVDHRSRQVFANQQIDRNPDNEVSEDIYRTRLDANLPLLSKFNVASNITAAKADFDREASTALEEDSDPDSVRYGGGISIGYRHSALNFFSLGSQYSRSNRDDTDIDQELIAYSLGFDRSLKSIQYRISAGYNELSFGSIDSTGGTFNANLRWQTAFNTLQITAQREKTSSGLQRAGNFLATAGDQSLNSQNNLADLNLDSAIEVSEFDAQISNTALCKRCTTELSFGFERTEYDSTFNLFNAIVIESTQPTEEVSDIEIDFDYSLSQRRSISFGAGYANVDVGREQGAQESRSFARSNFRLNYRADVTNRLTFNLTGFFTEQRFDEFSNEDNENSGVRLSLNYTFLESERPANRF